MATRSAIGIKNEDGTVTGVYCHWDGYPEHNGKILLEYYPEEKATRLVGFGDISSLGSEIFPKGEHTFEKKEQDVTVFYGRDRGEVGVGPRTFANEQEFFDEFADQVDYVYLMRNGAWAVRPSSKKNFVGVRRLIQVRDRQFA